MTRSKGGKVESAVMRAAVVGAAIIGAVIGREISSVGIGTATSMDDAAAVSVGAITGATLAVEVVVVGAAKFSTGVTGRSFKVDVDGDKGKAAWVAS